MDALEGEQAQSDDDETYGEAANLSREVPGDIGLQEDLNPIPAQPRPQVVEVGERGCCRGISECRPFSNRMPVTVLRKSGLTQTIHRYLPSTSNCCRKIRVSLM